MAGFVPAAGGAGIPAVADSWAVAGSRVAMEGNRRRWVAAGNWAPAVGAAWSLDCNRRFGRSLEVGCHSRSGCVHKRDGVPFHSCADQTWAETVAGFHTASAAAAGSRSPAAVADSSRAVADCTAAGNHPVAAGNSLAAPALKPPKQIRR